MDFGLIATLQLAATPAGVDARPFQPPEIVVTATRSETPADEVGNSVTVLEREQIDRSQDSFVSDLLVQVPGVSFSRNGGIGGLTSVRIRGAEADQTVLLIDGIKLNDPSAPGGGFNFANLMVRGIQRIEVLRGPQSTLWGSQAIGGVVHIITTPPGGERVSVLLEGGSFESRRISAEASGLVGRVGYAFSAGYLTTDGISSFAAARGGEERDGYRNFGASGRLSYELSQDVTLDLRGWYSRGRNEFDVPPRDTADFGRTAELIGYAGVTARMFGGGLVHRLSASATRTDRDNFNPDLPVRRTFDARGANQRLEYRGRASLAPGIHASFGAETERQEFHALSPTVADPDPPRLHGDVRLSSVHGYVQLQPRQGVNLAGGVRQDRHSRFGDATTGSVSGAFTPDGGRTILRASLGSGFKAPTLFQLLSEFGNPDLSPERGRGWDAGVESRLLGRRVTLSATYFGRRSSNLIAFVSCVANSDARCGPQPVGFYDNIQRTSAQGIEVAGHLRVIPRLLLRGQFTLTDTLNDSPGSPNRGNRLPRRPRHNAYAEVSYDWAWGLSAAVGVTLSGAAFDDQANRNRLGSYALVDVRARYRAAPKVELFARISNLFDESYETTLRYGSPGRNAAVGISFDL
jgi:vitamin B12 transporter